MLYVFKVLETFGESCPQFILQTCATLYADPTLQNELNWIQILTISSSFLSIIVTLTTVFQQMPYFIKVDNEDRVKAQYIY